jgi:cation diffusion facilitator CzcD-associated flavoprotein CzcO
LIVANGHHWDPRWPEPAFPGHERFAGEQLHSHQYTGEDPEQFRGKSVVVLGMGNSAMDIAVEASFVARHTHLAARRGAWSSPSTSSDGRSTRWRPRRASRTRCAGARRQRCSG